MPFCYRLQNGEQKAEFAIDGVHMNADGYRVVFENLKAYLPL